MREVSEKGYVGGPVRVPFGLQLFCRGWKKYEQYEEVHHKKIGMDRERRPGGAVWCIKVLVHSSVHPWVNYFCL